LVFFWYEKRGGGKGGICFFDFLTCFGRRKKEKKQYQVDGRSNVHLQREVVEEAQASQSREDAQARNAHDRKENKKKNRFNKSSRR